MTDGSSLPLLASIVFSAALVASALLGWLADLKRVGSSTSARETTRRTAQKSSRQRPSAAPRASSGARRAQTQASQKRSAQEQEERIREAYFAKERRAREERERRRQQQQARQRARRASGGPSGGSSSGGGAGSAPRPTGSPEARYRATLELRGPVTASSLRVAYRRLIAAYHPDRVATLGIKLQRLAEEETKRINEAYAYFRRSLRE